MHFVHPVPMLQNQRRTSRVPYKGKRSWRMCKNSVCLEHMALMSISQSITLAQTAKTCKTIGWFSRLFAQNFGDPLTFLWHPSQADICSFEWNFSTTIEWIVMTFSTDIHVPLVGKCNNCGDPLSFYLVSSWEHNFNLSKTLVSWYTAN